MASVLVRCNEATIVIQWKNEDGSILEIDSGIKPNSILLYAGKTSTKASDEQYVYTYDHWYSEITEAESNSIYTDVFSKLFIMGKSFLT